MRLQPVQTAAPAIDLVELGEAKQHCRVTHSDDDAYIAACAAAVVAHLDGPRGILRPSLIEQTWRDTWRGFPDERRIRLSAEPLISITSVEYVAYGETDWTTLDADNYWGYTDDLGCWVELADGLNWPDTAPRPEAVRATYKAGYGATAADVPAPIRHAAKLLIGHLYENREASVIGASIQVTELPFAVKALLQSYLRPPG